MSTGIPARSLVVVCVLQPSQGRVLLELHLAESCRICAPLLALSADVLMLMLPHWKMTCLQAFASSCQSMQSVFRSVLTAAAHKRQQIGQIARKVSTYRIPIDGQRDPCGAEGFHQRILLGSGRVYPTLCAQLRFCVDNAAPQVVGTFDWELYLATSRAHRLGYDASEPLSDEPCSDDPPCTLDWSRTSLDAADMLSTTPAILACQPISSGIKKLLLSFNPIGAACTALEALVVGLPSLEELELQECALSDASACALADGFLHETSGACCVLRSLRLGCNPIGNTGCAALAAALVSSPRLLRRDAASDGPESWGRGSSLRSQGDGKSGLVIFQLGDTSIGDAGATALAAALDKGAMPHGLQLWLAATQVTELGRGQVMMAASRCCASLRVCW